VVLRRGVRVGQSPLDLVRLAGRGLRLAAAGSSRTVRSRIVSVDMDRFVCVFFSLSDSKLIPYILPAMPALALSIAASSADALRREVFYSALGTVLVALALAAASMYAPRFLASTDRNHYFLMLARPLVRLPRAGHLRYLRHVPAPPRCYPCRGILERGVVFGRAASHAGRRVVAPVYSGVALARALGAIPRDEPFYSVATYDQTLAFYSQRTPKLVAYRGELDLVCATLPALKFPRWGISSASGKRYRKAMR